jgi:hypothetical protein
MTKMKITRKETANLLTKLRDKYDTYARDYSESYFNREEFEKRLLYAEQNRMDLSAFLLAEIANFEKLKDSFDEFQNKKNKQSFSEKIDIVIEEQLKQLKKYPKKAFHPRVGIEEAHMYGALTLLAEFYFPVLRLLSNEYDYKLAVEKIESKIEYFVLPTGSKLAPRTEDHALLLSRSGLREIDIEKK